MMNGCISYGFEGYVFSHSGFEVSNVLSFIPYER